MRVEFGGFIGFSISYSSKCIYIYILELYFLYFANLFRLLAAVAHRKLVEVLA